MPRRDARNTAEPTDPVARLTWLLELWDRTPAWPVAEAVIAADAALAQPPFAGDTPAWLKAAKRAGRTERGPLLAMLLGRTLAETAARLHAIAGWASDPRTIDAIARLITAPPWTSDSSKPTWNAVFELIAASHSARFVELAPRLAAGWDVRALFRPWLTNGLKRATQRLPAAAPVLEPALAEQLVALTRRLRVTPDAGVTTRDDAGLRAEIYARPHDDEPRAVYADLLQERGDPHGELIALQLADREPARQRALIKAHAATWLAPIAPVLGASYEFRRGFLARAMIKLRNKADADRYVDLATWATVEDLTWSHTTPIPHGQEPYVRKVGKHMRGLIKAFGAWAPDILAADHPWAIRELEVGLSGPDEVQDLVESPHLPALERLILDDRCEPAWFANVTSLRGIRTLEFYPDDLSQILRLLSRYHGLATYRAGRWLTATRGRDGQLSRLTLHLDDYTARSGGNLLRTLDDGIAESIELDIADGVDVRPELHQLARTKLRGARPSAFAPAPASTAVPAIEPPIAELAFRPDGSLVVLDRAQLLILDPTGTQLIARYPARNCDQARLIRGGTQVVATGYRAVHLYDLATGRDVVKAQPRIEQLDHDVLAVSDDERYVAICHNQAFDLDAPAALPPPRGAGRARAVRPDLTAWIVHGRRAAPCAVMRPGSTRKTPLEASTDLASLYYDGDDILGEAERGLRRWHGTTGALVARLDTGKLRKVVQSGRWLLAIEDRRLLVVDRRDLTVRATIAESLWWVGVDARGERLASIDGRSHALTIRSL